MEVGCNDDLTLSQTTNFRLFKTERVSRRQLKFNENGRKFSKQVEKTVGKVEIARKVFSRKLFSKGLYWRHVKTRAGLEKG